MSLASNASEQGKLVAIPSIERFLRERSLITPPIKLILLTPFGGEFSEIPEVSIGGTTVPVFNKAKLFGV